MFCFRGLRWLLAVAVSRSRATLCYRFPAEKTPEVKLRRLVRCGLVRLESSSFELLRGCN